MKHAPPSFARLFAWSVLLLGLSVGCGAGCGDPDPKPPPAAREMPDADRSTVEVSKALAIRANGKDTVDVKVTVLKADGTPLAGRTVKVTVSGEGNTVVQPAPTDARGLATAKVTSTQAGTKTVTASVEAEGGPVTLTSRPTLEFIVLPASKLAFTTAPSSGTAGTALGAFEVALRDGDGETVTGANHTVTVAIGSGPSAAALKGTVSVKAVNGVARFPDLLLEKAAQGYTLVASATGLTGATSSPFTVAPAAPASLVLAPELESVRAGSPMSLELSVRDAFDNVVTGYTGTVRFSSDDDSASLPADYTFTSADAGRHVFTNALVLKQAGTRQVMVKDTALTSIREVAVVPGTAARLVFTRQPANRSVRAAFDVEVVLLDAVGNRTTVGPPVVTLSLSKAGALTGSASVTPVDGVAFFPGLSIAQEDTDYTLTASAAGLPAVPSNAFTIIDDVKPDVPVLVQGATTRTSIALAWTAVGDDGSVGTASSYELRYSTTEITSDTEFATAIPVTLAAPKPAGAAESVTLTNLRPGNTYYVALKVTDNAGNAVLSTLPVSTPFSTATQVRFIEQPSNGTAGSALATIQVAIQDVDGWTVGNANSAVTLTVQGVAGFGPFTVTAVQGVATFGGVRIDTAGKGYTLVASSGGLTSDTSTPFDVAHAEPRHLELAGLGSRVTAGAANSATVTVRDAFGNLAEGYRGTVHFESNDTAATLPADYAFVALDKGQHTFEGGVVLRTSGMRTLSVSAAGLTSSTLELEVGHSAPSKLLLAGLPSAMTAGDSVDVTVELLDGFDNRATGYTGTVRFTSTDGKATLPAEYTFTTTDKGFQTFSVKLVTAGPRSLKVEDKDAPTLSAEANTSVKWAPVASLVLDAPDSAVAGAPFSAKLTALDVHGNLVKDYTSTVTFSADAAKATVPAAYTFTLGDEGSRQFDFVLKEAVSTKLTVTDGTLSASDTVALSHAAPSVLVMATPAGPFTAGTAFTVDVTLEDAYGNVATGYTGTVGFTSSDGKALLPADYTFVTGDAGRKSFSMTLKTAGSQSLSVKDLVSTFLSASDSLQVNPNAPTRLVFRSQPASDKVRKLMAPVTVAITDDHDNTIPTTTPSIQVELVGGNPDAFLGGTTSVAPVDGLATFADLTVDQQGTDFRLMATATGLTDLTSTPFTILDDRAPDSTPLSVVGQTSIRVELSWKAVGDDGQEGFADSYDLRYSTSPITDELTFSFATPVATGVPQSRGSTETALLGGLTPSTRYYFALKVKDDAGNASAFTTTDTTTNDDPCDGYTCSAPSPTCAADGVSLVSYSATCIDVDNTATCQQSQTTMACPGANAVCFKNVCDTAAKPTAPQLTITEVMHNPSTGTTPYFEVLNNTSNLLNLQGLLVSNSVSDTSFTVGDGSTVPVVVDRKGTFVLAENKDLATNGGVSANYAYGSDLVLGASGQLRIHNGTKLVEEVGWTTEFPKTRGKAMSLSTLVMGTKANAQPWYWCDSESQLAGGDYGTPNATNSTCGITVAPPVDWCNIQYPKSFPSGDGQYPDTISSNSSWTIYSRFYEPGITDRNTMSGNDYYPHVFAELGYGKDATNPAGWTWTPVSYNSGYSLMGNDDEMMGTLRIPTLGTFRYGFRYRFWEPATSSYTPYVYCDQSGAVTPPAGSYGTVTVSAPVLSDHVVISEFAVNGPGGADDEFIELYNPTDMEVDMSGWKLQYKAATTGTYTGSYTLPANSKIAARGYFLVVSTLYSGTMTVPANATYPSNAGMALGGSVGHVRLGMPGVSTAKTDAQAVDTVGYGSTADSAEGSPITPVHGSGGSFERKAVSTSTAATMASSGADALRGNSHDSNNNASDFVLRTTRQPQNASSVIEWP